MSKAAFGFAMLREGDPESLGDFRLVARLGEGGMGRVFLAFSPGGQPAAVKVIRSEFAGDAQFGRRFAQEVAAAQRARGAYLAPLLDADPEGERPWLATGYVAGPSLLDLVTAGGPLPAGEVMLLAWGIAHALADIHGADVVHRDLKPGNIMLDESGPKVIDFGIVKSLTQSVTHRSNSTRIGTPLYMSPEQALGRPVGPSSDVFALGSTLHFLAVGREAFAADNEWAVAHRIVADHPDLTDLAPPLRHLIAACLDKDPAKRPTPLQVRAWCETELGDTLAPGAWMNITGAREAIRQRTQALRSMTAPQEKAAPDSPEDPPRNAPGPGQSGQSEGETSALDPAADPSDPPRPSERSTESNEIPPRRVIATRAVHTLGVLLLLPAVCTFPFQKESWTARSSGVPMGSVTEAFDLHHPWQTFSTGISGVSTDAGSFIGALVVGTALCIAFALLALLRWSRNPILRCSGAAAHIMCSLWLSLFTIACMVMVGATVFGPKPDDNPAYMLHVDLKTGAWALLLANIWIAYVLWGKPERSE
ncbi:protein kinase [Kitasatospora cineracea]|uniref:serine/threonine-protein kinase n=1 Tax=Kitasatospora cineracea TaxID=88074 RepID=UPI00341A8F5A